MDLFLLIVFILKVSFVFTLNNGLALTPPMGWMSWERYRCTVDCDSFPNDCLNEELIRKTAEVMVSDGYLSAGYNYVIIDDCWLEMKRDHKDRLQADKNRFPNGIKHLADYVHSLGLKFGIYQNFGRTTCKYYPGSIDHLEIDANTFAEWGVDYVKFDGCYTNVALLDDGYTEFGKFLNQTGRPMVYSCSWPAYKGAKTNYTSVLETCNLWRNYVYDIDDSWESVLKILDWFSENQRKFISLAGPGGWNDPDTLILGNFGLTFDQNKAQMALWAIMAAPLIMSNDLKQVRPDIKDILQNRDIIALNQDGLGIQGRLVYSDYDFEVWIKPVLPLIGIYESYGIVIFNRQPLWRPRRFTLPMKSLNLNFSYRLKDLFEPEKSPKKATDYLDVMVNPMGVVVLRATPDISFFYGR